MPNISPERIRDYLWSLPHGESRKMAKAIGISEQTITNIRRGRMKNPTWETMRKISEYRERMEQP